MIELASVWCLKGRHSVVFWQCPPVSWGLLCICFLDLASHSTVLVSLLWRHPQSVPWSLCTCHSCYWSLYGVLTCYSHLYTWISSTWPFRKRSSSSLCQNTPRSSFPHPSLDSLLIIALNFWNKRPVLLCVMCVLWADRHLPRTPSRYSSAWCGVDTQKMTNQWPLVQNGKMLESASWDVSFCFRKNVPRHGPVIQLLEWWYQEVNKFKASLGNLVRYCLKKLSKN